METAIGQDQINFYVYGQNHKKAHVGGRNKNKNIIKF